MTLREFLLDEIKQRDMSMRQFAEFVGVANTTITRAVDPENAPPPSLEFLVKLAKATKTDIRTIVAIVAPDAVIEQSPDVLRLAERISRLNDDQRRLIDATITGLVFKGNHTEK